MIYIVHRLTSNSQYFEKRFSNIKNQCGWGMNVTTLRQIRLTTTGNVWVRVGTTNIYLRSSYNALTISNRQKMYLR